MISNIQMVIVNFSSKSVSESVLNTRSVSFIRATRNSHAISPCGLISVTVLIDSNVINHTNKDTVWPASTPARS